MGYWPGSSNKGPFPQLGMWKVLQYFGLRQGTVALNPSSRTELKARLSSKSWSLFSSHEVGGDRTRLVRGQLAEGGEAAARPPAPGAPHVK